MLVVDSFMDSFVDSFLVCTSVLLADSLDFTEPCDGDLSTSIINKLNILRIYLETTGIS